MCRLTSSINTDVYKHSFLASRVLSFERSHHYISTHPVLMSIFFTTSPLPAFILHKPASLTSPSQVPTMSQSNNKPPDQDDLMTENEDRPANQQQHLGKSFPTQKFFYFERRGRFYRAYGTAAFKHLWCHLGNYPLHRNHRPLKNHWNRRKRSPNPHTSRSTSRRSKPRQTRATTDAERARLSIHTASPSTLSRGICKPIFYQPCHLGLATSADLSRASIPYPAHGQAHHDQDRGEEPYPFPTYQLPSSHISLPVRSRHLAIGDGESGKDQLVEPTLDAEDHANQPDRATIRTGTEENSHPKSLESLSMYPLANEGDYLMVDMSGRWAEWRDWIERENVSEWGDRPEWEDMSEWGCEE